MNCMNCGATVAPGSSVCPNCGSPIGGNNGGMPPQNNMPNQMDPNMNLNMANGMPPANGGMPPQNNMPNQMDPNMNPNMANGMPPMNGGMPPQNNMPNQMDPNMNLNTANGMPPMNGGMPPQNNMPNQMMNNMDYNMGLPTGPDNSGLPGGKEKKKVSPLLIFLIIVLIGVLAYAGPYWYKQWFGKDKTSNGDTIEEGNEVSESSSIVFNDYTFSSPSGYSWSINDNKVIVNNSNYVMVLLPVHMKYDDLKTNIADLKEVVTKVGVTYDDKTDYAVSNGSSEYLVFNGKYQDKDVNYFYTKLGDNDSLEGVIFKNTDKFDDAYTVVNSLVAGVTIALNSEEATYSKDKLGISNIDISLVNDSFSLSSSGESEEETVLGETE